MKPVSQRSESKALGLEESVKALLAFDVADLNDLDALAEWPAPVRSFVLASLVIPAINTNQVTTRALVNDGETIVLGGVFREEKSVTESKTPILGDLPYVGRLFKRSNRSSRRTELLIFITPKILDELPR